MHIVNNAQAGNFTFLTSSNKRWLALKPGSRPLRYGS